MQNERQEVLKQFKLSRMIWPLLIGVGVLAYALWDLSKTDLDIEQIMSYTTTSKVVKWLGLGFLVMIIRDVGYIWRMRILTDGKLNLRSAFEVTLLWEFASALTPSVVGGSALAIFMLVKEKISLGRSTAIVFITIFLDEIFYLMMLPLVLIAVGQDVVFGPVNGDGSAFGTGLIVSFWIAYGVIFAYTVFLAFAIFVRPEGTSRIFKKLFKTRLFKRWEHRGEKMANDLLTASHEFRSKPFVYWIKAYGATFMAWMGRYLVLNCVLSAFTDLNLYEHTVAFARQAIMFVVMIVSPTPGSSGIAETVFEALFTEFSPVGLVLMLAIIWRLISYYPYVFIGIPLINRWTARVFK